MENKDWQGPQFKWLREGVCGRPGVGSSLRSPFKKELTAYIITDHLCSKASHWLCWDCVRSAVFWGPSPALPPPPLPATGINPQQPPCTTNSASHCQTDTDRVPQWGHQGTLNLTKPLSVLPFKQANLPSTLGLSITLLHQRSCVYLPASLSCILSAFPDNSKFSIKKCRHCAQLFTGTVPFSPQNCYRYLTGWVGALAFKREEREGGHKKRDFGASQVARC